MRPSKACLQCRVTKRRCVLDPVGQHEICLTCRHRQVECSLSWKRKAQRSILPLSVTPTALSLQADGPYLTSNEVLEECISLYLRFIHDRPHSLFHEKSLWNDFKADSLPRCLLYAICALGCRFSLDESHRSLASDFGARSRALFAQGLEAMSISNVQTCILLANVCAAEQNNAQELLYFGIANRMAYVLQLHHTQADDPPVLREIKCRLWWSLFMADRWCPPGLGLPRDTLMSQQSVQMPMHEIDFRAMSPTSQTPLPVRDDGLWKHMIMLVDIFAGIQDLNLSLVNSDRDKSAIDAEVAHLADRLEDWNNSLPPHVVMNNSNLDVYRTIGHGGTFVALHLGYHHYSTLLYFHQLESASDQQDETSIYADRCRHHALAYSQLLYSARSRRDCHVVYLTVAYMTMVSSSVLLHMLLFGDDRDVAVARLQLTRNFEALIDLTQYWSHMDQITKRLLIFQNACLASPDRKAFAINRWMMRFLLHHALPLHTENVEADSWEDSPRSSIQDPAILPERRYMLDEAFADLRHNA